MSTIPMYRQGTYVERLMARYEVQPDGCWQWTGTYRGDTGYGAITRPDQVTVGAHVAMWEHLRERVSSGLELDHLCRNRGCVNPDHLEPVTPAENQRRAAPYRPKPEPKVKPLRTAPTHCRAGLHDLSDANRLVEGGYVICRPCRLESRRAYHRRKVAALAPRFSEGRGGS